MSSQEMTTRYPIKEGFRSVREITIIKCSCIMVEIHQATTSGETVEKP